MSDQWQQRSLASLGSYENGFAFNELHWSEHGLPIIRIAQITGSQGIVDHFPGVLSDSYRIDDGDLIFSWSGTLAVVRWSGGPAWLNQHLFKVVPADGIDRSFLFHVLQASVAEMGKRTHGSTMKHIKRGELREFLVEIPGSEREQRKIAQILDTLDTAIRETEALIDKLKAVKQGLLHDLLTRGIDANGQLRPPQSEAPQLYKESPLGWIPREWEAVSISDLATNLDGRRIPIKEGFRKVGEIPYYGASGVIDWVDSYIFDGDYVLLGEDGENVVSRRLPLAFRASGKIWVNNHAHIYEPKPGVDIRFLVELMEAKDYSPWISGSAQPKITQEALSRISFVRPPSGEQAEIGIRLEKLRARIDLETAQLAKLQRGKAGLMDDLLTGRVRVIPLLESVPQAAAKIVQQPVGQMGA